MRGRKDNTQDAFVELWVALGCCWIPCNQYALLGFDGILVDRNGKIHIVEIKTRERYVLTNVEQKRKAMVERSGGKYDIVWNSVQAERLAYGE